MGVSPPLLLAVWLLICCPAPRPVSAVSCSSAECGACLASCAACSQCGLCVLCTVPGITASVALSTIYYLQLD